MGLGSGLELALHLISRVCLLPFLFLGALTTSSFLECWGGGLTRKKSLLFSLMPYIFICFLPMYFQELLVSPSFALKPRAAQPLTLLLPVTSPQHLTIAHWLARAPLLHSGRNHHDLARGRPGPLDSEYSLSEPTASRLKS